jgi:hypothetical protein
MKLERAFLKEPAIAAVGESKRRLSKGEAVEFAANLKGMVKPTKATSGS